MPTVYVSKSNQDIKKYLSTLISQSWTICLSGGSLTNLVEFEQKSFSKQIFFSDERLVKLGDKDSNYAGYAEKFKNAEITQITTINDSLLHDHNQLLKDYEQRIRSLPSHLDLTLLGMGPDGHTASLFPTSETLKSTSIVELITNSPKPPSERVTLTLPILSASKLIVFVVLGGSKAKVVHEILDLGVEYPAGMVSGNVVWVLDKDSASEYKGEREDLPI
jgi:6-phosphogluconolactonase